jgi:hypothetical protein
MILSAGALAASQPICRPVALAMYDWQLESAAGRKIMMNAGAYTSDHAICFSLLQVFIITNIASIC